MPPRHSSVHDEGHGELRDWIHSDDGVSSFLTAEEVSKIPAGLLAESLFRINLLSDPSDLLGFRDLGVWTRGGAETYVAHFALKTCRGGWQRYVAKAIVTLGSPPDVVARTWVERAKRLSAAGVSVLDLFGPWRGTVFQEFKRHSLAEQFSMIDAAGRVLLAESFLQEARAVGRAGFRPIALGHDYRADDEGIYLADLGWDLGAPTEGTSFESAAEDVAAAWLKGTVGNLDARQDPIRLE